MMSVWCLAGKVAQVVERWYSSWAGQVRITEQTWLFWLRIVVNIFLMGEWIYLRACHWVVSSSFFFPIFYNHLPLSTFWSQSKIFTKETREVWGLHNTEVTYLPITQLPPVLFPEVKNFLLMLKKFTDCTGVNSGQRLDNDNWTHLKLASGKLVLQKNENYSKTKVSYIKSP